MPWKVFSHEDGYAVWKIDDDGKKLGKPLSRNPKTKRAAAAQAQALYAKEDKNEDRPGKSIGADFFEDGFIFVGNTLKSLEDAEGKIGAHSVVFGDADNKDFHGDFFTKNTFFGHNNGNGAVATINHRMPFLKKGYFAPDVEKVIKSITQRVMKNPIKTTVDDVGIFSELVCDLSDKYEKMIFALASAGKLKWSSGSAPHLIQSKKNGGGELEMFVITEQALTPIPAEHRMLDHRVMPMKSYLDYLRS